MAGIKYNRLKRIFTNFKSKYVFWACMDKLKIEEKYKCTKHARETVVLSFYDLDEVSPFPTSINYLINLFYRSMQPYVQELQIWFGENECNRQYHDLSAQYSQVFDFMNIYEYYPGCNLSKLTNTECLKSFVPGPDDDSCIIEVRNIKSVLERLRKHEIPFPFSWQYHIIDLEIDYNIYSQSDSE